MIIRLSIKYLSLHRCVFEGEECPISLLQETLTNSGKCITFNGDGLGMIYTQQTGAVRGLRLLLSPNSYDSLHTLENTQGIKVSIHYRKISGIKTIL